VFANTNAGQSSSSGVENVYQTAGFAAPAAPTVTATPGQESVELSWLQPSTPDAATISQYEVFDECPGESNPVAVSGGTLSPTATASTAQTFVVTGLTPGQTCTFFVTAVYGNGAGVYGTATAMANSSGATSAPVTTPTEIVSPTPVTTIPTTAPSTSGSTSGAASTSAASNTGSSSTSSTSSTAGASSTSTAVKKTTTTLSSPIFAGTGKPGITTFRFVATYTAHILTTSGALVTGGTVTFTNDGHVMCKAPVVRGVALCTSRLATKAAVLVIGATFNPSPAYSASKTHVDLEVQRAPDSVQLVRKKIAKGLYRYTAYIRPVKKIGGAGVPRGTVTFEDEEGTICTARLHNEVASCTSSIVSPIYNAVYHPGKDFEPEMVEGK